MPPYYQQRTEISVCCGIMNFTYSCPEESSHASPVDYTSLIINVLTVVMLLVGVVGAKYKTIWSALTRQPSPSQQKLEGIEKAVTQTVTVHIGEVKSALTSLAAEVRSASMGSASSSHADSNV
jgi:hypothetical protein